MKSQIKKSCENCQDYTVCWAYDKLKTEEEAQNCADWELDFMTFQNMLDKNNK